MRKMPAVATAAPATPNSFFAHRRHILVALAAAFAFLAIAAASANAWLLMHWDEPIQRVVESNRNDALDSFVLTASMSNGASPQPDEAVSVAR